MTRLLLVALLAMPLVAEERARIEGRVVYENGPLPGVTVRLGARETFTDAEGRYAFDRVPPGSYELHYELAGFGKSLRRIAADAGPNVLRDEELPLDQEVAILSCEIAACTDADAPDSRWDASPCAEYDFNTPLIEAAGNGDRSAIALLQQQYERASTYRERHRIAGALLNRMRDDRAIWNELVQHAKIALEVPRNDEEYTPEFREWCEARGVRHDDFWSMSLNALRVAANDRRARPLLLRALESGDAVLIDAAITGFALQRDESALPAITAALERLKELPPWLVAPLVFYRSEAADRLAFRFLQEDDRAEYLSWRDEVEP